jgi:enoyl-CoA hydratase/3-hydroxyacyl-CoA dehydrogenase
MGHGIAEVAALAGYDFIPRDTDEEFVQNGYEQLVWSIERLADHGHVDDLYETGVDEIFDPRTSIDQIIEFIEQNLPER